MRKLSHIANVILFIVAMTGNTTRAQVFQTESMAFEFDAVIFNSGIDTAQSRADCYMIIPYASLNFVRSGDVFGAKYEYILTLLDSSGNRLDMEKGERSLTEYDYFIAQGGTAKFDYLRHSFIMKKGNYKIRAEITDKYSNQKYERQRAVTALDFSQFKLSLSGILLVSSIEEINGRFSITPHLSDNVGSLSDGFFLFFEIYNNPLIDSLDLLYQIIGSDGSIVFQSDRARKAIRKPIEREFIKVEKLTNFPSGSYTLRLAALNPAESGAIKESMFLAAALRSFKYYPSIGGHILADINLALRQMKYVAYQEDINFIEAGATSEEKQKRFLEFWEKLDPSPTTDRNEAFEDYFSRVTFATRNFKAYTEGWLTDKGMVYIVYGPPTSSERYTSYSDNRVYERWTYARNTREFIFVDNTGFGDFRLVRPYTVTERYKYEK